MTDDDDELDEQPTMISSPSFEAMLEARAAEGGEEPDRPTPMDPAYAKTAMGPSFDERLKAQEQAKPDPFAPPPSAGGPIGGAQPGPPKPPAPAPPQAPGGPPAPASPFSGPNSPFAAPPPQAAPSAPQQHSPAPPGQTGGTPPTMMMSAAQPPGSAPGAAPQGWGPGGTPWQPQAPAQPVAQPAQSSGGGLSPMALFLISLGIVFVLGSCVGLGVLYAVLA